MPSAPTLAATYWRGFRHGLPFLLVVGPFGAVFGVIATEAGLSLAQTMGFTVLVIAGASQITALQLMQDQAPTLIVLAAALAVNLRMAMYSAALTPYLGQLSLLKRAVIAYFLVDQSYAMAQLEYERAPQMPLTERVTYFFGVVTPICPFWYLFTWLGAVMGARIPEGLAIDFAVPITFLAIIAPGLKSIAHVGAALTSIIVALALAGLPYNLGLLVAAVAAMIVGAEIDRRFNLNPEPQDDA